MRVLAIRLNSMATDSILFWTLDSWFSIHIYNSQLRLHIQYTYSISMHGGVIGKELVQQVIPRRALYSLKVPIGDDLLVDCLS